MGIRYYEVAGIKLPSVTSVLDVQDKGEGLLKWACNLGYKESRRVFSDAQQRGIKAHSLLADIITGTPHEVSDEWLQRETNLRKFFKEAGLVLDGDTLSEYKVYSLRYGFAGTLDLCAEFDSFPGIAGRSRLVLDLKTTSAIRESCKLQTVAYSVALNERRPELNIDGRGVLWINDKGEVVPKLYKRSQDVSDWMGFHGLLQAFNWVNRGRFNVKEPAAIAAKESASE